MHSTLELNEELVNKLRSALGDGAPAQAAQQQQFRVLVLDDDTVDRRSMVRALSRLNRIGDILEAECIAAARVLLHSQHVDLAVLDYNLPDGEGVELISDALARGVTVLMVTGAGNERVAVRALNAGAVDYLVKDVPGEYLNLLEPTLQGAIHRRELEQERTDLLHRVSDALETIRMLSTLVHICAVCKKIRSEDASWEPLEQYVAQRAHTRFSHGLCPQCYTKAREELGL